MGTGSGVVLILFFLLAGAGSERTRETQRPRRRMLVNNGLMLELDHGLITAGKQGQLVTLASVLSD